MIRQSPKAFLVAALCLSFGSIPGAFATEPAGFVVPVDPPQIASLGIADTAKVKILRMPDGALIIAYAQSQDTGQNVYDIRTQQTRMPRDIVVQYSLDSGANWSPPLNIDGTAAQSSHLGIVDPGARPTIFRQDHPDASYIDLDSEPRAIAYPGDSGKPQVFNTSTNIVIAWGSKFCPTDEERWPAEQQRIIAYQELGWITNPYACIWAARMKWNPAASNFAAIGPADEPFITEQFSSGYRDAHSYVHAPQKPGIGMVWQEDPMGLQTGLAEGPGTGASGALSTGGTNLWYAALPLGSIAIDASSWTTPALLTDNAEVFRQLDDVDRVTHEPGHYEYGQAAASRPNIKLVGTRAVVAWEERKVEEREDGKYVRYHSWGDFRSTTAFPMHGCIISHPLENARRVRILTQAGSAGSTNIVFLYKQGVLTQAGPSDIMMRRAIQGFDPDNIFPAIDTERCRGHVKYFDEDTVGEDEYLDSPPDDMRLGDVHLAAINLSGSAVPMALPGTAPNATSSANTLEDSQAHRGQIRGDTVLVGYSHTPDQAAFNTFANSIPYNFYITTSWDGGDTWSKPHNFSDLTATSGLSVREPRIVGTSGNGPGCSPVTDPADPSDCQDKSVFYIGFGTQNNVNVDEVAVDLDLYMGLAVDHGRRFSRPQAITPGDVINADPDGVTDREMQLKTQPDGEEAYVVWARNSDMTKDVAFVVLNRDGIFGCSFEQ